MEKLNALYFYLTSYCNLNCLHCWIDPACINKEEAPEEAPFALLKDIIDQALPLGLSSIKITGGEPFLNKNIFKLIDYASGKKLSINIETNATLIDDITARFLSRKSINHIAMSLDGPNLQVHEALRPKIGCFDKAIRGVKFLKKYNLNVQVIISIYKGNVEYLEDTINLAEGYGANSIKINHISRISRGGLLKERDLTLRVEDYINLNRKIDEEIQPRHKIKLVMDIPPAFKVLKKIKEEGCVCGIKNILGILSDGSISICGIGEILPSLRLGDAGKQNLREIWQDNDVLKKIRRDMPSMLKGICGLCIFKGLCLGKCRAEAYYANKDLFSPFSFCEEAFKSGLFPENRIFAKKEEICA